VNQRRGSQTDIDFTELVPPPLEAQPTRKRNANSNFFGSMPLLQPYMAGTHSMPHCKANDQETPSEGTLQERGLASFHKGRYDEAVAFLSQAIAEDAANHDLRLHRASSYMAVHAFKPAALDIRMVLTALPEHHIAWLRLGDAYTGMRCYDKAHKAYKRAMRVSPSYEFTRKARHLADQALYRRNSFIISMSGSAPRLPVKAGVQTVPSARSKRSQARPSSPLACEIKVKARQQIRRMLLETDGYVEDPNGDTAGKDSNNHNSRLQDECFFTETVENLVPT